MEMLSNAQQIQRGLVAEEVVSTAFKRHHAAGRPVRHLLQCVRRLQLSGVILALGGRVLAEVSCNFFVDQLRRPIERAFGILNSQ